MMSDWRVLAALPLASLVAIVAWRAGALTISGALAAAVIGGAAVVAGWSWAILIIVYFVATMALSRLGHARKEKLTASIVAKRGPRDAWQVVANGFAFTVAAVGWKLTGETGWLGLAAGSLAASAADTWATEIGTLYGGTPRSILSWRPVPAGTSGAVSLVGSVGAVAGALTIGLIAWLVGWPRMVALVSVIGGIVGALLDSLLGATVQDRRWCERCSVETEREVHSCGRPTLALRGAEWIDNDMVNLLSGLGGGLLSLFLAR